MADVIKALGALVPDYTEKRKHKRADLTFKVALSKQPAGAAVPSGVAPPAGLLTENVSMGGLGLRWDQGSGGGPALAKGDDVYITIQVPRMERVVRCRGRIAWIHADGGRYVRAGVTFDGISLDDLAGVQALLDGPAQP
jgi:hypothetical protein